MNRMRSPGSQRSRLLPRPAAGRPTTGRGAVRPPVRRGRPRPSRRPNPALLLGLAVLLVVLLAGGYAVWRGLLTRGAGPNSAAAQAPDGTAVLAGAATALPTLMPAPTLTPTRRPVAVAQMPGGTPALSTAPAAVATAAPALPAPTQGPSSAAAGSSSPAPTQALTRPTMAMPTAPRQEEGAALDVAALGQQMLALVNADRRANGLRPVEWDATAAVAAQKHAEEMAALGYMSHWNVDGYGPDHRYSQAGGRDFSQENVYQLQYRWEDGTGAPIDDWDEVVRNAEEALMNSPGHRKNILAPEHTHLGVGIAYNPASGTVGLAQEFVNRYAAIESLPSRAGRGDRIVLRGRLLPTALEPLVNVAYEPLPSPMTLEELGNTGTYTPKAQPIEAPTVHVDADGSFVSEYTLGAQAKPGLYHVVVWVNIEGMNERVPAVDAVIEVR